MTPVHLQDIADELSMIFEELKSYVDRETGQVFTVRMDDLHEAQDEAGRTAGEASDDDEMDEDLRMARAIVADPLRFPQLPTQWDIDEWEIMREFADTSAPDALRPRLLESLQAGR